MALVIVGGYSSAQYVGQNVSVDFLIFLFFFVKLYVGISLVLRNLLEVIKPQWKVASNNTLESTVTDRCFL